MAVQLSHPQGAFVCSFCSFTSSDYEVLGKHLLNHWGFKERKHDHNLWYGLCKPSSTDANHRDGHNQAISNEVYLNESMYYDNNDFGYGDASNYYYPGYNGLYNPYAIPNAYYYPMNIAYRNPCYGNNGYYQTHNTIFYSDDFYDGTDILPILNTPRFIESPPENKYLLDTPHSSDNICNEDSFARSSNYSKSVNSDCGIEILPVDSQIFNEVNSLSKPYYQESSIGEICVLSDSMANAELNVVQLNEFGTISHIEPQHEGNKSSIQQVSDKTLSRKFNGTRAKKISSKGITDPERNAVKKRPFQINVRETSGSETVSENLAESSNVVFLSEAGPKGVGSSIGNPNSSIETNSSNLNVNTRGIPPLKKDEDCYSKPPTEKLAEPSENNANASSTGELPVLFSEAVDTENIVINDVSGISNCSISAEVDTQSENSLMKECNSQLHTYEHEESSGSFLGKVSIPVQDINASISCAESSKVYTTEYSLDVETGSIDKNCPLTAIDLNEKHSECSTGKLETLSKIQNFNSVLSENDTPVSAVEPSPKIKYVIDSESNLSDIQTQPTSMNRDQRKKDKVLINSKQKGSFKSDRRQGKIVTRGDALDGNSLQKSKDNCIRALTESSEKGQSDKTGALSNVANSLRNSCRNDSNFTYKSYESVISLNHTSLTYSEAVKRGLPLKSSS